MIASVAWLLVIACQVYVIIKSRSTIRNCRRTEENFRRSERAFNEIERIRAAR